VTARSLEIILKAAHCSPLTRRVRCAKVPAERPLLQRDVVLSAAVCLGAARLLRVRNRLDLYG
jgi:hypothetical protein